MSQDLNAYAEPDCWRPTAARRPLERVGLGLAAAALLVPLVVAGVAASEDAMPGQVLYPVKRGAEQAELLAADSSEAATQLHIEFAHTRLEELRSVREHRPDAVPALAAAAIAELDKVPLGGGTAAILRAEARSELRSVISGR